MHKNSVKKLISFDAEKHIDTINIECHINTRH